MILLYHINFLFFPKDVAKPWESCAISKEFLGNVPAVLQLREHGLESGGVGYIKYKWRDLQIN